MVDAVAVVGTPHLAGQEFRRGKLLEERIQPPRRCKDVLKMQLGPVQPLRMLGEGPDNGILNVRFAKEAGISGEVAAARPQFVLERTVPGSFRSELKREETDIAG
ncbi:hypothetical protein [Mesorhizobium sp.]|uniref:hypothetical protein n=1 Tax=Mesorhizobium sp. TaxID=1871066 RepID=UPI0025BAA92A|nr:hypothetical protein [Mesorhizobium sp.]